MAFKIGVIISCIVLLTDDAIQVTDYSIKKQSDIFLRKVYYTEFNAFADGKRIIGSPALVSEILHFE